MKSGLKGLWIVLIVVAMAFGAQVLIQSATASDCAKTYDNFGKTFMEKYCTFCHTSAKSGFARKGAPKGIDFDKTDIIAKEKGEILEYVLVKGKMPPKGGLSDAEKADLKSWLDCEYAKAP